MGVGKMMLKLAMVCGLMLSVSTYSSTAFAGNNAPTFTLRDINKQEVSLEDYKGKVVLVNFWATWCGPCQAEMPHLQKMYGFRRARIVVLSISADNARDASKALFDKAQPIYVSVLLDTDCFSINIIQNLCYPTMFDW